MGSGHRKKKKVRKKRQEKKQQRAQRPVAAAGAPAQPGEQVGTGQAGAGGEDREAKEPGS